MAETLYLLDSHSLIYQSFHAISGMTGPKGQPTNAVFGFVGDLLRLRKKNPSYLVCAFDTPGKTFRDAISAEYKANRAPMPDDLQLQIPVIHRVLQAMRVPVIQVPGYEADDLIATIAREGDRRGIDVLIGTADKDCRQLISDRVKLYKFRRNEEQIMGREDLKADWGITPEQVVDLLTLVGDSVDNVKGVPGVGIKTAPRLLNEFGSIEGILAHVDEVKGDKLRENLRAFADKVETGRQLIRLRDDVPVPFDWDAWRVQPIDAPALLAIFQECGLTRYANEIRAEAARQKAHALRSHAQGVPPKPPRDGMLFDLGEEEASPSPISKLDFQWHLVDSPESFEQFLDALKQQSRTAIDLETTGLHPLSAEIVGCAICWNAGEGYYVAVCGPAGQMTLDPQVVLQALRPVLESPQVAKVNQNIKYDLLVLRAAGVELAGVAGDPMVADYLLSPGERSHNLDDLSQRHLGHTPIPIESLIGSGKHKRAMDSVEVARIAEYAAEDAVLAWRLCEKLEPRLDEYGMAGLYRELEIPLIEVLADLEYTGIRINLDLLQRLSGEFAAQLADLERQIHDLAGRPFNIHSPSQLREVLFDELKLPESRRTGITGEASTRQEVLEDLAAEGHALPRKIIEYRQFAKLKSTYVDALPALVHPRTGRVHAGFNQTVAATGRLSSSDPNLQNIPIRTEMGRQIRQAFVPGEPGWRLLTADYSQIELRVLAHLSGDDELRRAFEEDRDIHNFVAAQIYGVAEKDVNSEQRRNAKTVNFGVIYGLSAFGLGKRLGIRQRDAEAFIDQYFARYPRVLEFQQKVLDDTRRDGYVSTILGRRRWFDPTSIRKTSSHRQRNQAEREALNTVIQGSAADLIKRAMLNIFRRLRREQRAARMLLQIHDELVFEAPAAEIEPLADLVADEMTSAIPLSVPLKVDAAAGENWLDVETIELKPGAEGSR